MSPSKGNRKSADSDDEDFEDHPAESEGEESPAEDDAEVEGLGNELKDATEEAPSRSQCIDKGPKGSYPISFSKLKFFPPQITN